jgi:hypothetical protein
MAGLVNGGNSPKTEQFDGISSKKGIKQMAT